MGYFHTRNTKKGSNSTLEDKRMHHKKTTWFIARLANKFQMAWDNAESSTNIKAKTVIAGLYHILSKGTGDLYSHTHNYLMLSVFTLGKEWSSGPKKNDLMTILHALIKILLFTSSYLSKKL